MASYYGPQGFERLLLWGAAGVNAAYRAATGKDIAWLVDEDDGEEPTKEP